MGADFAFSIMFLRTHVVKYLKRLVKPTSQDENQPDWSRSDSREEEEHLIDVMNTDGEVKVIALLPSIQKEDIRIHCAEDTLTISVETPQRRYYKEIGLPAKVNPEKAETSYKNCVLEVTLPKKTGVRSIGNTFDM